MERIVIVAARANTALGNLDATWDGIFAGRSALAPSNLSGPPGEYPVGMITGLADDWGSKDRIESLLCMLLDDIPPIPQKTALVVATTKGAVDELLSKPAGPWPMQPWDLGNSIAEKTGLRGPVSTVSGACASGTLALITAAQRLVSGEVHTALVLGVDVLSRFVLSGFSKLQAVSPSPCRPFDKDRKGLSLGEGAGLLLLSTEQEARKQGWPLLAEVSGWGAACDASHITAPSREASGLRAAIMAATSNGKIKVGGINAHGTGTRFNDAMELFAFRTLWQNQPVFHSVKGAIGHCLGAAGVIEAALAIKSLATGTIPPTVGLENPDPEAFNISGNEILPLSDPTVLSCNSGFGGINAAVVLSRSEASG